jgi:ATP-dependent Clp protease ATP-binding subunit ClpA
MNTFEQTIQRSYQLAAGRNHELVTLEHLLAALLEDPDICKMIRKSKGNLESISKSTQEYLDDPSNHVVVQGGTTQPRHTQLLMNVVKKAKTQSLFSGRNDMSSIDLLLAMYGIQDSPASYFLDRNGPTKEELIEQLSRGSGSDTDIVDESEAIETLETYCINLNRKAENGRIDPLIGREKEVETITQVLAKRNKHNVILVGDAGVGKTQVVEGLAKRIIEGDVPESLMDKTIWSIDIANLVAGTKFRGDFEERMKAIIKAFRSLPDAVMFLDEIHMIMGAGNAGGSGGGTLDAANMLKPPLSRGEIRCIGSTTDDEYRKHFEKDRALARRFQKLDVDEPSVEDSKRILRGIARYYEEYHGLTYEPAALDAAVDLTSKHMHGKFLPDKAIDVIDSAAAWQKIRPESERIKTITKREIEAEVGRVAKIPVQTVKTSEVDKLARLEQDIKAVIFGQDEAVESLSSMVWLGRSGLREVEKTVGAFLFSGPSGTGKTETAKQLAKTLGVEFVRFDMSEFQEKHAVSKLIGSPPGYVGYSDGSAGSGVLINTLEKSPHCVLLFDEIEKAHPDVYNVFLQIMDHGMITAQNGKQASARNAIVIFTSNLGAADMERSAIGFASTERTDEDIKAINEYFRPEFRNRLDGIVRFNKLSKADIHRIIDKFLAQMNDLSRKKGVSIMLDAGAKEWLINHGFDRNMGARPLARCITNEIKKPLAKEILFGRLKNGGAVMVHEKDGKLDFEYIENPESPDDDGELLMVDVVKNGENA